VKNSLWRFKIFFKKVYFLRGYFTCGKYPGNGENIGN
jgi:hypothetical protein